MVVRCFVLFFLFSSSIILGQLYNVGQNPSSTKWSQIKTDDFQLIFPDDFQGKAQELANLISYANEKSRLTLKTKPRKISIILQNNTTVDNGFVTLAPKRSEFYATPSQENDGVDWLKKLAVHEYRHVVQFEKYEEGVGNILKLIFGEQGMGALIVMTTPLWMIEGDAVMVETQHTERGRGDYGPFLREFKAQLMEMDSLCYEKASFGSFKHYITDHYKLGYFLSEFVKDEFGANVWDSLMHKIVRNPFPPYPFSYHLKRITGKSTSQLYGDLIAATRKKIMSKRGFYEATPKEILSPKNSDYVSYQNPIFVNDDDFIACKKSFNHPLKFVLIADGKESVIHIPGNYDQNSLRFSQSTLIWSEKRNHPRWDYLDYSEIITFDFSKKTRKRLKRKTRWFAPTFSPRGDRIALVEYSKNNQPSILIVNLKGVELQRFNLEFGQVYHPNWFAEDSIVFTRLHGDDNTLEIIELNSGSLKISKSFSVPLSYATKYKNGFLVQTLSGNKDCIAFFEFKNRGELKEVINPEYGLKFLSLDLSNQNLLYSDYHSNGFKIAKSEIEVGSAIPSNWSKFTDNLAISNDIFKVQKYRPMLHLFNFHSWAPFSIKPANESANLGASLFSQNLLGSSIFSLNYDYFSYTKSHEFSAKYDFERFYPKFFGQAIKKIQPNTLFQSVLSDIQRTTYIAGSELELYFNGSKFSKLALIRGTYVYSESDIEFITGLPVFEDTLLGIEFVQQYGEISSLFGVFHKKGLRDIYSPLSLIASSTFSFDFKEKQNAQFLNISTTIPGLNKNDGFKFEVARQWGQGIVAPNYLTMPRGVLNKFYISGQKLTAQYALPLFYPDWKISRLAYIQRFRADFFYDFLQVYDNFETSYLSSQGGSFYIDFNPLRYSQLATFGIQIGSDRNGDIFLSSSFFVNY